MKKPLKIIIAVLVVLAVGGAIGSFSAVAAYENIYSRGVLRNGQWATNLAVGTSEASMYTRANVALHGLLALAKSETVYYQCTGDDKGLPLQSGCDYRIEGKPLDTRWWSITAYGQDDFLIPNAAKRYSINTNTVKTGEDGSFVIHLSSAESEGNWLPSGTKAQKVTVTLRLYNPGPSVYADPGSIELPRVIREGCK